MVSTVSNRRFEIGRMKKRGYLWVTLGLFLISISAHWVFAWFAYVEEAIEHSQPVQLSSYLNQTIRDTMENWQSEFLQLMWQVAGLDTLVCWLASVKGRA